VLELETHPARIQPALASAPYDRWVTPEGEVKAEFHRQPAGFLVRFPKKTTDTFEVQEVVDWRARFKEFLKVRAMFDVWYAWERAYQEKRQAAKGAA
jgi:hypothetical protein